MRCDTLLIEVSTGITLSVGPVCARGTVTWKTMDRIGIAFDRPVAASAYATLVG